LEDKEVVGGDVVDDGEKDEEVQRMYSISEVDVVERDDGEGKQDARTGVATVTEIIRDTGVPSWSFMAARGVRKRKRRGKKTNPRGHSNMKKGHPYI